MASKPFTVHRLALSEIEHERRYFQRRTANGAALVAAVEEAFGRMCEWPTAFAPVDVVRGATVRSVRLKRFRFRIYFGDLGDVIRVFAFAHVARRPGYWKRRVGR